MASGGLSYQWARLNQAEKLIAINVLVFVLAGLLETLGVVQDPDRWFRLPADLPAFFAQPWSIITYSFFHGGLWHILFNMIWLYFSGRLVLNLFDRMRFLTVYFLGVLIGGFAFVAAYNIFPALVPEYMHLIGASAGVLAIFIFICAYIPNQEVRIFTFNVKLWQIGAFFVVLDLLRLSGGGNNVGGYIAHLGGAAIGYLYGRQLLNGRDIASGFTRFLDGLGRAFTPGAKKVPFKKVYKNSPKKPRSKKSTAVDKSEKQKKIDDILDKISKSGYDSLTKDEKDFLFQAGKEE